MDLFRLRSLYPPSINLAFSDNCLVEFNKQSADVTEIETMHIQNLTIFTISDKSNEGPSQLAMSRTVRNMCVMCKTVMTSYVLNLSRETSDLLVVLSKTN